MSVTGDLSAIAFFAAGTATAAVYLGLLWCSVAVLVRRRAYLPLFLGTLARFGWLAFVGLVAIFLQPTALQFLAAVLGFLLGRVIILKATQGPAKSTKNGAR